jgi:hypothetical protein
VNRLPFLTGLAAVAGAFWAGSLGMRLVLATAPLAVTTDLAQPLPVVTAWHDFGVRCFGVLAATIAIATVGLATALLRLPADAWPRGRLAIGLAAGAALLGAATWPCTFSSDPYAYAAYGAEAARGIDPYAPLAANVHGVSIDAARYQWSGPFPVCVYGPAFVALAEALWRLSQRLGTGAPIALLRAAASAAFLASIGLVDALLRDLAPRRRLGLLGAYALQPVSLWSAAEGHNDTFVLLACAGGLLLWRRGLPFAGAVLLGLSAAFKATGGLFAAGFALDAIARRERGRRIAGVLGGLLLATLVTLGPLARALAEIRGHGRYAPQISLAALVGLAPAIAVAGMLVGAGSVRVARGRRDGFAWLGLGVVAVLPNVYPWYALWLVPLALVADPGDAALALYGVTIFAVLRYLPDAVGTMTAGALRIAAVAALTPVLVVGIAPLLRRKQVST